MEKIDCLSCGSSGLKIFYEQRGVAVDSCRLLGSKKEAQEFPKGDISLGFCPKCGFISNTALDPVLLDQSSAYEETQTFSPYFRGFLTKLAESLIEKYDIHGKSILEIGCGKGDFLEIICRLGRNKGIGFDANIERNQIRQRENKQIRFVKDKFSEKFKHLVGDVVICRHILEHTHFVRKFLASLREALTGSSDVIVIFEVPDMKRILRETAFWDIYYEHCSYFNFGALARLFRSVGFRVLDIGLCFHEQYILIECCPGYDEGKIFDIEQKPEETFREILNFQKNHEMNLSEWQGRLCDLIEKNKRVVLWGSGSKAAAFLKPLDLTLQIEYVVNINPNQRDKYVAGTGQMIVPPAFLKKYKPHLVVNLNSIYEKEISKMLNNLGVETRLVSVGQNKYVS